MEEDKNETVNINRVVYMEKFNKNDISNIKGNIKKRDYEEFILQLKNLATSDNLDYKEFKRKWSNNTPTIKQISARESDLMHLKMPNKLNNFKSKHSSNNLSTFNRLASKNHGKY